MSSNPLNLKDASLFLQKGLVGDQWVEAKSAKVFAIHDPSTGRAVAQAPEMDADDVLDAISAATTAFSMFKKTTARYRARLLRAFNDALLANIDDLATLIVAENGKPRKEAEGEVIYAASFVEWFSGEAERAYGLTIPAANPSSRIMTVKQPIGVVAALCPWNLPIAMASRKVAAAIAAGCSTVLKPAGETPLASLAMAMIALRAGIPPGVLNVVTALENTAVVGEVLSKDARVRKLSLTGSTRVGKLLATNSASTLKKLSLELGGNAPVIIFQDANLAKVIPNVLLSKMRNGGQTCVAANRIFVQRSVLDDVTRRLGVELAKMKVGGGLEADSIIGPLISKAAVDKAAKHVLQATSRGAKVAWRADSKTYLPDKFTDGHFYPPTVLTGLTDKMTIWTEETFGPVAALAVFDKEEDVIRLANDSEVGLGAYIYTQDIGRALRVAEAIESGMVGINTGMLSACESPFGGVKGSGYGREGSHYALDEYLTVKAINIDVS